MARPRPWQYLDVVYTVGDTAIDVKVGYQNDRSWEVEEINIGGVDAFELFYKIPGEERKLNDRIQTAVDDALETRNLKEEQCDD